MSELIAIVGESGQGKSTSVRTLNPKETFIINISKKRLPFPKATENYKEFHTKSDEGKKGNYFETHNYKHIVEVMTFISSARPDIKNIVIDDFQYLMSDEFMQRAYENGWQKYTDIARHAYDVLTTGSKLRKDIKVFILCHEEQITDAGIKKRKIKTIGKLLDNHITLEGLFTIVLFTEVRKEVDKEFSEYYFSTQTDGTTTAKSPMGLFSKLLIPNDLKLVAEAIDNY